MGTILTLRVSYPNPFANHTRASYFSNSLSPDILLSYILPILDTRIPLSRQIPSGPSICNTTSTHRGGLLFVTWPPQDPKDARCRNAPVSERCAPHGKRAEDAIGSPFFVPHPHGTPKCNSKKSIAKDNDMPFIRLLSCAPAATSPSIRGSSPNRG